MQNQELFRLFIEKRINKDNFKTFGISKAKYYKIRSRFITWQQLVDPITEMILSLSDRQFLSMAKPNVKIVRRAWHGFSPTIEKEPYDVDHLDNRNLVYNSEENEQKKKAGKDSRKDSKI